MQSARARRRTTTGLFVSTMHNMVYGFNATAPGSAPLWVQNLGTTMTTADIGRSCGDIPIETARRPVFCFQMRRQHGPRPTMRF